MGGFFTFGVALSISRVLVMASYNVVGLKALTHSCNGLAIPSTKSMTRLCSQRFVTMTAIHFNSMMYSFGVPVYLICANSLKCISGSFRSCSISLWLKSL